MTSLMNPIILRGLLLIAWGTLGFQAMAQEAQIRKALTSRLPDLPSIEEVRKTPIAGVYELRLANNEILYADAQGQYLIQGSIFDLKAKRNLTEERTQQINFIPFENLPTQDAMTFVRGDGSRKFALFEDPNCGYCKRLERDFQKLDNVTIHVFLYPVLGADSAEKSKNIWCAKDKAKIWADWMLNNKTPPTAECDSSAITRAMEFGKKHKITGTPTLVFTNGARVPGAVSLAQVEQMLAENAAGNKKP